MYIVPFWVNLALLSQLTRRDTVNPMRPTNDGIGDTEHFSLSCPSFEVPIKDLFARESTMLRALGHTNLSNEFLMQILLHGDKTLLMVSIKIQFR